MLRNVRNWFGERLSSKQTLFCKGTMDCIVDRELRALGLDAELEEAWMRQYRPVLDELFALPEAPMTADPKERILLVDVTLDLSGVSRSTSGSVSISMNDAVTGPLSLAALLLVFTPTQILRRMLPLPLRRTAIRLHAQLRDPLNGVVIVRRTVTRRLSWLRTLDRNLAWTHAARAEYLQDLLVSAGLELLEKLAKDGARL